VAGRASRRIFREFRRDFLQDGGKRLENGWFAAITAFSPNGDRREQGNEERPGGTAPLPGTRKCQAKLLPATNAFSPLFSVGIS